MEKSNFCFQIRIACSILQPNLNISNSNFKDVIRVKFNEYWKSKWFIVTSTTVHKDTKLVFPIKQSNIKRNIKVETKWYISNVLPFLLLLSYELIENCRWPHQIFSSAVTPLFCSLYACLFLSQFINYWQNLQVPYELWVIRKKRRIIYLSYSIPHPI